MSENRGKGVKRNDGKISYESPTKAPRIDVGNLEVHAQHDIPSQGHGQPIPSGSLPGYARTETYGISKIIMDFEGETGRTLKQSLIESILSCPTDLDLICSDGVASVHRFVLMGVSKFFFKLLFDRDVKDTEAITLDNVSLSHLTLALELIYSGVTIVKDTDETGLHEVFNLFEIQMKLDRKEATDEDLGTHGTLEQVEVTINDDDDNNMQIVEEDGETSGNEAETGEASKNNASAVEELDVIDDDFFTATDNESETGVEVLEANTDNQGDDNEKDKDAGDGDDRRRQNTGDDCELIDLTLDLDCEDENWNRNGSDGASCLDASSSQRPRNPMNVAEAAPSQFDLRDPCPTKGHITLNGKKIRWHLMEALPSLTSPELRPERLRVFTLNIIKRPRASLYAKVRKLFKSLPENSLEKRLGMMAVECRNYKEIDLVKMLQPSKPDFYNRALHIKDVKLVERASLVRRINFDEHKSTSQPVVSLINKMLNDENARYNLENYKKVINGNMSMEQVLKIGNIEGLEDRTKAVIKMNVARPTLRIRRFIGPPLGFHEDYMKSSPDQPEIGGIGWNVWSHNSLMHWQSDVFMFNVTGTQILFPMLEKDVHLATKVKQAQTKTPPSSCFDIGGVAVSPKCLIENGISCFPVVQKPGMIIYKHHSDPTRDISKLRLGMGAEIEL